MKPLYIGNYWQTCVIDFVPSEVVFLSELPNPVILPAPRLSLRTRRREVNIQQEGVNYFESFGNDCENIGGASVSPDHLLVLVDAVAAQTVTIRVKLDIPDIIPLDAWT